MDTVIVILYYEYFLFDYEQFPTARSNSLILNHTLKQFYMNSDDYVRACGLKQYCNIK